MKSILYLFLFTFNTYAADWVETTIREDALNFYYVGVSSPKKTQKEALEDAYASALNELVRHNFGMIHNFMGQYSQTEKDIEVKQNTLLYRSGVKIVGVIPLRKKISQEEDMYIAFREVSYPKSQIIVEQERLKHMKTKKYELEPIKKEKREKKTENVEEKKKLTELPTLSFVWLPYAQTQESAEFIYLPFRIDIYPAKYIGMGVFYSYDEDEFEDKEDQNLKTVRTTTEMALDLKLYPIRTKMVSLGVGVEYFSFEEETVLDRGYDDEMIAKNKFEGTGKNAVLKIKLTQPSLDTSGKSLYVDYREYEQRKVISAGISFDF